MISLESCLLRMKKVPGVLESKVFVSHIPCTVSEEELLEAFDRFGPRLQHFYLADRRNGDHGFAFITFSESSAALLATQSLNGSDLFENSIRPVRVSLACEKQFDSLPFDDFVAQVPSASWREYKTDEGFFYYHNADTGDTVWEKPAHFLPHAHVAIEPRAHKLGPQGANLFFAGSEVSDIEMFGEILSTKSCNEFTFVAFADAESANQARAAFPGRFSLRPGEISS